MKLFAGIVLLVLSIFTLQVYAQFDDEPDYEPPYCPNNGLSYYKNCKGSLDQCSTCLGNAERACVKATGESCFGCTTLAGGACDSAKPMCFGNRECSGGRDYKCINYECVYDPYLLYTQSTLFEKYKFNF